MLSEPIRQRIVEKYEQLSSDGKLLSPQQLDKYYATFRQKFGPQALSQLDGEALLETMHGTESGNRDDLMYWLEFKNDDEFPSPFFGGIKGGVASKFGVYKRAENGVWAKPGAGKKPQEITVEEAVAIARKHREQLRLGVEALEKLKSPGTDDDYGQLQAQLDQVAPDVSNAGWGHKYFHLLFPDKLDDFHASEWQRFHLRKLLQQPPEGNGRYLCAGRFVAAAKQVGLPMIHFTTTLNSLHGRPHRYWRIGTTDGTTGESFWPMMRDGSRIAVGWKDLKDISWLEATTESRGKLKALLEERCPNHPAAIGRDVSQLSQFVLEIAEGDVVLAADGMTILGVGRVRGGYEFHSEIGFPHQRAVDWLTVDPWQLPESGEGLRSTVRELGKSSENLLGIERHLQSPSGSAPVPPSGETPKRPARLSGIPGRIQSILERKGQVVLHGPPGTGKTFWAERAANDLAAISAFGKLFETLDETERQIVLGHGDNAGLVRLCCFHPAYGYEDFLEGFRPETVNKQMAFTLRAGVFKQLCLDAALAPKRHFILIVDEINRGDIPRIFGELLTVLEQDKRGKSILLPVSRESFRVPPNVFLIGTMNTADRSVSLLDAALRRRFGFIELMPDSAPLKGHSVAGIPLAPWFDALNERICKHVDRDARNLQIGHSYLLSGGHPVKDLATLKRIVRDDLIPLIEEYCYEDSDALRAILGAGFFDESQRRVQYDLFDDGREDALIAALKQPCPDIFRTAEANAAEVAAAEAKQDDDDGTTGEAS